MVPIGSLGTHFEVQTSCREFSDSISFPFLIVSKFKRHNGFRGIRSKTTRRECRRLRYASLEFLGCLCPDSRLEVETSCRESGCCVVTAAHTQLCHMPVRDIEQSGGTSSEWLVCYFAPSGQIRE